MGKQFDMINLTLTKYNPKYWDWVNICMDLFSKKKYFLEKFKMNKRQKLLFKLGLKLNRIEKYKKVDLIYYN